MSASHFIVGLIALVLFGVVVYLGARQDRSEEMARQHGIMGRVRCSSCRKAWRCFVACDPISEELSRAEDMHDGRYR